MVFRGIRGISLLPFEPQGHIDHAGSHCLFPDCTGAYVHVLSIDHSPSNCVSSPLLSPQDVTAGDVVFSG